MASQTNPDRATAGQDREARIARPARAFAAPRQAVCDAWTDYP